MATDLDALLAAGFDEEVLSDAEEIVDDAQPEDGELPDAEGVSEASAVKPRASVKKQRLKDTGRPFYTAQARFSALNSSRLTLEGTGTRDCNAHSTRAAGEEGTSRPLWLNVSYCGVADTPVVAPVRALWS